MGAVDYGEVYGECDYGGCEHGGCVMVKVWVRYGLGLGYGFGYGLGYGVIVRVWGYC